MEYTERTNVWVFALTLYQFCFDSDVVCPLPKPLTLLHITNLYKGILHQIWCRAQDINAKISS